MNLNMAVIGASGSGKTLFCINFAEYMGAGSLSYLEIAPGGQRRGLLSPAGARRLMVGRGRRNSKAVRTFTVHLPLRPYCRLALIDTAALPERNPLLCFERSRLMLILQAVERADLILMLIDLTCIDPAVQEFCDRAGNYLADYCRQQGKLFLTGGGKADLLSRATVRQPPLYADANLLMISSITLTGFARLKEVVLETSFTVSSGNMVN